MTKDTRFISVVNIVEVLHLMKKGFFIIPNTADFKFLFSDEEILKEKIYSLYQSIIGTKTLNKTVKGYIRNRLDNEYKDKKEIQPETKEENK